MAKRTAIHKPSRLKEKFLAEFRKSGNISVAAEAVGMSRRLHYTWLEEDKDGAYRLAYEDACEDAGDVLEAEAHRRAVEGVEEPVGWYQGQPGGYVRRYSDTLLIVLLKMRGRFRDGVEVTGKDGSPFQLVVRAMSDQELMGYAALLDLGVEAPSLECSRLLPPGDGEGEP